MHNFEVHLDLMEICEKRFDLSHIQRFQPKKVSKHLQHKLKRNPNEIGWMGNLIEEYN